MLKELKFVQGAVAKKDFIPSLTHFEIKDGKIKGFNGKLALCAPIPISFDIKPRAIPFVKAIQGCKNDTVQLSITPTGRLSVKAGRNKFLVDCCEEDFPDVQPEGNWMSLEGINIIPAFKALLDFTGEDASRPWAMGIMLRDTFAYATNNIILMEYDLGATFPIPINVPKNAVAEVVRIGQEPKGIMICESSVTFMYDEHLWVKTQLYETNWPDLNRVLDSTGADMQPISEEVFEAVRTVSPFVDELNRVIFKDGSVTTNTEGGAGGTVTLDDFSYEGVYNYKYFLSLEGLITKIDLTKYPSPCVFEGENIRGALMGMRL